MDLVGTVRREEHEGGYSIWVLVDEWNWSEPYWLCVDSTAVGNCGARFPVRSPIGEHPIIGVVPGSTADIAERAAFAREVQEDRTRDAGGRE